VFEGGGFGVGVTVTPLDVQPYPVELLPPGVTARPTRLGEMMPVAARTDAEIALELQRVQQMEARLAAYTAELVAELAARRPDSLDRQIGEPGAAASEWLPGAGRQTATGVSEFFADELALILNCSRTAAPKLADSAALLIERLPATWAALADGQLDWPRARALAADLLEPARDVEPQVIAEVEAAVLSRAGALSIRQLQATARRELLRRDAAAADRRRGQAEQTADVVVRPAGDGMAVMSWFMPQPLAVAIRDTADRYARMAKKDGDPRPIGQIRVGVLADLVMRAWDTSRPPVSAHLTVVAPLGALTIGASGHHPCVVAQVPPRAADPAAGLTSSGPTARTCSGCACSQPATVAGEPITSAHLRSLLEQLDALCPGGLRAPAGGTLDIAVTDPGTGALRATVTRKELERLVRRGCPDHPQERCRCPVLDRPPPVDRYMPTPLDHVVPHGEGGPTDCENLCCLCWRHHRLKTHAPGWRFVMTDDGLLSVTTPSGVTRMTRPPGLAHRSGSPSLPDDDPPPF
jgi:uncharacterized protein DUF222